MGQEPGIVGEDFSFTASDGERVRAFRAQPTGNVQTGRIVIFPEIWGLTPWVRSVVERFAREGFRAVSFELFQRQGPAESGADWPALRARAAKLDVAQALRDARSALDQLAAGPEGVIGFCMGGTLALHYAAQNAQTRACVACYGRLREDTLEQARRISCAALGVYGARDASIPLEDVEKLSGALPEGSEMSIFDAGHAFLNDTRPDYYADEPATLAWAKIQGYFTRQLS